ncbi:MAG: hypothetical protein LBQ30_06590 [Treponema sp.]|jgi:uncharacterized membrane-anchored protein|nr:hypothetical protein [Treponema sp.]
MIQFYFLSILCNTLAGYMLIRREAAACTLGNDIETLVQHDTVRLVLGIISIITGLFKLLSAVQGDIPVIGDLLPALSGFASGSVLLFDYYLARTTLGETGTTASMNLGRFLLAHKRQIGFTALGTAVLHFLFPQALFI